MSAMFHLLPIVEGHGEVDALPTLLHKICKGSERELRVERPYRIRRDMFVNNKDKRRVCIGVMGYKCRNLLPNASIVILLDAESDCCKGFLHGEQMKAIQKDMDELLGDNIPYFFALAEKGYESWLAAGFGGGNPDNHGNPAKWLTENSDTCGLSGPYSKIPDQLKLTEKLDIDKVREVNRSFCRFREKILALPRAK